LKRDRSVRDAPPGCTILTSHTADDAPCPVAVRGAIDAAGRRPDYFTADAARNMANVARIYDTLVDKRLIPTRNSSRIAANARALRPGPIQPDPVNCGARHLRATSHHFSIFRRFPA
jgi:hypothetical protein